MATTKKTKVAKKEEVKEAVKSSVVIGPRITEKSAIGSMKGQYTFNVATNATKSEIVKAIRTLYKVEPVKIAITQRTAKVVLRRGKFGTKQGGKKAVVYLKKGDKIEFA